ncbi:MAG TPA: tetratricopeptide repeat protein [Thermodesulfovibrionales bacterium]|nr:tetratricopeptide repeat protein [Thermodesulfovibrionales bacterium]
MPKAIKKKIAKPAKKEEDVSNIVHRVRESLGERQRFLLPVFIGAVVVLLVVAGISLYRSNMNAKAETLEYEGYRAYYGFQQKQPFQKGEQYQKALEDFRKANEMRKSPFALFYIASCYDGMGKYEDALKALNELNERFPDDEKFVPLTYYKMAVIAFKKGDKDAALKLLDTLYNYRTGSFKDLALMESARILESMGKTEEAAKKLEELKKNFPNSPFLRAPQGQPPAS